MFTRKPDPKKKPLSPQASTKPSSDSSSDFLNPLNPVGLFSDSFGGSSDSSSSSSSSSSSDSFSGGGGDFGGGGSSGDW